MKDAHTLIPMGVGDPETFRCRIYGAEDDPDDIERAAFIDRLAGDGVIDCPAYDQWVIALIERGWLPDNPELEPNPDGPGRVGRWRLTDLGRAAWARMMAP